MSYIVLNEGDFPIPFKRWFYEDIVAFFYITDEHDTPHVHLAYKNSPNYNVSLAPSGRKCRLEIPRYYNSVGNSKIQPDELVFCEKLPEELTKKVLNLLNTKEHGIYYWEDMASEWRKLFRYNKRYPFKQSYDFTGKKISDKK